TGVGAETLKVHPNEGTAKGMAERIDAAAEAALAAWEARYNNQKDLMQYAGVLPKHIRDPLANHEPMEKPVEGMLLDDQQRATFKEEIPKHMPTMAGKIQATWKFNPDGTEKTDAQKESERIGGGDRGGGGAGGDSDSKDSPAMDLVIWSKKNQTLWNTKVTTFQGFHGNLDDQGRPTTSQILALSQDLWILSGIFDVIAKVNEGYTANDLAPIERLDHVLVGSEAINSELGSLTVMSYKVPSLQGVQEEKNRGGSASRKKSKQESQREATRRKTKKSRAAKRAAKRSTPFQPNASKSPFHGRYVDRDFTQLNESEITSVITSDSLTEQSYLAVAKRVPVRIAVKMDERRINDFLAAAANSPFAFEIRQVRVNKHNPSEVPELTASGSGGGAGSEDESGRPSMAGGSGGGGLVDGNSPGGGGGEDAEDGPFLPHTRTNFDVKIEFIGIVKVYNPVNRSLFFPEEAQVASSGNPASAGN
ncbi:MAG: hypothetical protein P8J33_08790, partial [Pirellulaceae bacterium]|nr:hypothetical protein [Pirellulaceae bacterium]